MTHRPLLWITASAVVLGAAAWSPASAGAAAAGWTITIADPGAIESHRFAVTGNIDLAGGDVESVTVTLEPSFALPESCGPAPAPTTVAPSGTTYRADVEVTCNGPYEVQVVANGKMLLGALAVSSGEPETHDVGVAEPPEPPVLDLVEASPAGAVANWSAAPRPDAAGWIIRVNERDEHQYDDPAATSVELAGDFGSATFDMRALSWGAGGPGTGPVESDVSNGWLLTDYQPPDTNPEPPPTDPPPGPGGGPGTTPTPTTPGGGTPTPTTGRIPTRGPGSQDTLPEGYTEELPFGTVDDAFVPGSSTTRPDADEEQAAGTSPSAGLVRTSERTSPGLVAPFALALLLITVAAHIAWYLRRSKPSDGGGQVSLP